MWQPAKTTRGKRELMEGTATGSARWAEFIRNTAPGGSAGRSGPPLHPGAFDPRKLVLFPLGQITMLRAL